MTEPKEAQTIALDLVARLYLIASGTLKADPETAYRQAKAAINKALKEAEERGAREEAELRELGV
jgi:hypothetical protein